MNSKGLVCYLPMHYGTMSGVLLFDESYNGFKGTLVNTPVPSYPGIKCSTGDSSAVDVGTGPTSVSTVGMWIKLDSTAGSNFAVILNATDSLSIEDGTLTQNGFEGGTAVLYVNGVAGNTVTTNWTFIAITDSLAKNADDIDVGNSNGIIADFFLYNYVLTADEIRSIYETTRWRYGV